MDKYLVDVPVCMSVWIRPELQRMTFEPIRQARPSVLFLASDGGRNDAEWDKIYQSRKIVENIDWECTVYKIYEEKNNGMYTMGRKVMRYIFDRVDRVIIFEDDTLADPSYFRFCAELLEKYKDDQRIQWIWGSNDWRKGIYERPGSDYFFVKAGGYNTGTAIWKRSLQGADGQIIYDDKTWLKDPYVFNLLSSKEKGFISRKMHRQLKETNGDSYSGHLVGTEFYGKLLGALSNQLGIRSKMNLVRQMGATDDAAHGVALYKLDKKTQEDYQRPLYSVSFPLKHPPYIIRDTVYEEFVNKEYSHIKVRYRKFITRIKRLYYGDGKLMLRSLWRRIKDNQIEK